MRRDARYCSNACSVKAKDQARTPRQRRDQHLRSQYGITHDEYDAMLAKQGGGCAICGDDGAGSRCGVLHVDHCHNSSAIRGLLCESCNLALGKFRDDPELLRRAAEYIEKGKA